MLFYFYYYYYTAFVSLIITANGKKALKGIVCRICLRRRNRALAEQISMDVEKYKKFFRKKELVLKTRRFESLAFISSNTNLQSKSSDKSENKLDANDNVDDPTCSICLCKVHHGDRIGALTCDHTFHVDCLKVWLKRKNVCPLCICPDAAETRIRYVERSIVDATI